MVAVAATTRVGVIKVIVAVGTADGASVLVEILAGVEVAGNP